MVKRSMSEKMEPVEKKWILIQAYPITVKLIYCKYFKAENLKIASSGNMSQLNKLHFFLRDFAKNRFLDMKSSFLKKIEENQQFT